MLLNCGEIGVEELKRVTVVLAAGGPSGVARLAPMLERFVGTVLIVRELSEFDRTVRPASEAAVVLSDPTVEGGGWRDVLRCTQSLAIPPSFVLATHQSDGSTWAELFSGGGFDLLPAPWSEASVQRVVSSGARRWLRAREIARARSAGPLLFDATGGR